MKIEILGMGCPRCHHTEENVKKALSELNKTAEVVRVSDINVIMEKGVIQTPALIINGEIAVQGKVPAVEQIKELIWKEEDNG